MIALPPIQFDRTTGVLEGANSWERLAALAFASGSKVASSFSHCGYGHCANLLRKMLPERDIAIKLNADAIFAFPYGDGYWIKLLDRSFAYENDLGMLFLDSVDVDYTLIDCGANFGFFGMQVFGESGDGLFGGWADAADGGGGLPGGGVAIEFADQHGQGRS